MPWAGSGIVMSGEWQYEGYPKGKRTEMDHFRGRQHNSTNYAGHGIWVQCPKCPKWVWLNRLRYAPVCPSCGSWYRARDYDLFKDIYGGEEVHWGRAPPPKGGKGKSKRHPGKGPPSGPAWGPPEVDISEGGASRIASMVGDFQNRQLGTSGGGAPSDQLVQLWDQLTLSLLDHGVMPAQLREAVAQTIRDRVDSRKDPVADAQKRYKDASGNSAAWDKAWESQARAGAKAKTG